jgi:RNA polymerase sigma factor (sigma-70 family)
LRIAARRQEEELPRGYESLADADNPLAACERSHLADALISLSAAERRLIFLRYWEDRTEQQIAAMLAIPTETVKVTLHRARAKLAGSLRAEAGFGAGLGRRDVGISEGDQASALLVP